MCYDDSVRIVVESKVYIPEVLFLRRYFMYFTNFTDKNREIEYSNISRRISLYTAMCQMI